jgi:serine protease SohB
VIRIESTGGEVSFYGHLFNELERLRLAGIRLVACVDKVACSGGYLAVCCSNLIIAPNFASVGGIGVISHLPNFERMLSTLGVNVDVLAVGKRKLSHNMFGKNDAETIDCLREDLVLIWKLFKATVSRYRPAVDMEKVGTGQVWLAEDALKLGLIDQVCTSSDYLLRLSKTHTVIKLFKKKKSEGFLTRALSFLYPAVRDCREYFTKN